LYGDLKEIKTRYRSHAVIVDYEGELGQVPGIVEKRPHKGYTELVMDNSTNPRKVLEQLMKSGINISRFEIATPSLNEIFLEVAGKNHE
jgi:ABC-2 type transport system ATP-binding protein